MMDMDWNCIVARAKYKWIIEHHDKGYSKLLETFLLARTRNWTIIATTWIFFDIPLQNSMNNYLIENVSLHLVRQHLVVAYDEKFTPSVSATIEIIISTRQ